MEEFYFTPRLTEAEHEIIEEKVREYCYAKELDMVYYRKFKNGHVPLYRECKVIGPKPAINRFKDYLENVEHVPIENKNAKT